MEPAILRVQERPPKFDEELAELGLVGEVGGFDGSVVVSETGSSDAFLRPFALE